MRNEKNEYEHTVQPVLRVLFRKLNIHVFCDYA